MRVGFAYSEEFEVIGDVHQGSVLSQLLCAITVKVLQKMQEGCG